MPSRTRSRRNVGFGRIPRSNEAIIQAPVLEHVQVFRPTHAAQQAPTTPSDWIVFQPPKLSPARHAFAEETARAVARLFD